MQNIMCSGHHFSPSEYFTVDQTSSCRTTSYHTPTCPQVFHRGLFVTPLEKGILESQQSLAKGKATVLKSCTCSAQCKWLSAQPTRDGTSFPKPSTTNRFIFNYFYSESPRSNDNGNVCAAWGHPFLPPWLVEGRGHRKLAGYPPLEVQQWCQGPGDPWFPERFPERLQDSWQNIFHDFCVTVSCRETSSGEVQTHLARGVGQNKLAE